MAKFLCHRRSLTSRVVGRWGDLTESKETKRKLHRVRVHENASPSFYTTLPQRYGTQVSIFFGSEETEKWGVVQCHLRYVFSSTAVGLRYNRPSTIYGRIVHSLPTIESSSTCIDGTIVRSLDGCRVVRGKSSFAKCGGTEAQLSTIYGIIVRNRR